MVYNRFKPNNFWDYIWEKPSVWAPPLIGIALILLFAAAPACLIVFLNDKGWTITPICWVYLVLCLCYVAAFIGIGAASNSPEVNDEGDPTCLLSVIFAFLFLPVVASVICMGCLMLGASLVAWILPGTATGMELSGGPDFLLYPGMAFRNAGFVMIPFLLYSLLALLRAKIQWEDLTSNRAPSTSRW